MTAPRLAVLMVCMGNICRSPTAEAVLRRQLEQAGLAGQVTVDSAGTHGYHVGDPPDERSQQHARRRGLDLSALRARRVQDADFERFDLLLAMDRDNLAELQRNCPAALAPRLKLMLDFSPRRDGPREVPDPYYGGPQGFETVLDLVEQASAGVVAHLRERLQGTC